ncbi:hypothetical protein Tco_1201061 [Tanacetum coccineum]
MERRITHQNDRKPINKKTSSQLWILFVYITRYGGKNLEKMKKRGSMCHGGIFYSVKGISCLQQVETRLIVEASVPQGQKAQIMTTLTPCPQDKSCFLQEGFRISLQFLLEDYSNPNTSR